MNLAPLTFQHPSGQLFRHTDGGYYRFLLSVYSSVDQSEKVVYQHVWPFAESPWERPVAEFINRFSPITESDLAAAMAKPREQVQKEIAAAKADRRAKEQSAANKN